MNQSDWLKLFLFTPLVSAIFTMVIPANKIVVHLLSISISIINCSLLVFIATEGNIEVINWQWISIGATSLNFTFEISRQTLPLTFATSFISLLINIYSAGFFKWDKQQPRYWFTLNLFTFSMLGLTLSANLFQTFIFWELVGLSSYLLISFYRDKPEAGRAASKALLMNKIGDVGFIVSLMAIFSSIHSFDINLLSSASFSAEVSWVIGIGLCLAIFSKSAQFPFHTWLPDAMEGPTPISALMHSATMVAAGVFLLIRYHFLIPIEILEVIAVVGATTAIIGGVHALRESDLKKLLAWSTISQLGLMVMVAGLRSFAPAYLYLLSHAIFKAGLFLAAGVLISNTGFNSLNDLRKSPKSIILTLTMTFLALSLMGLPLTIGFLAKEYIIGSITSPIYLGVFFLINGFTVLYASRIIFIVFPLPNFKRQTIEPLLMMIPLIILGIASLWIIYSFSPFSVSWIQDNWEIKPPGFSLTIFSLSWIISLSYISFLLIRKNYIDNLISWVPSISLDQFYNSYLIKPLLFTASITDQIDSKIIDKTIHGFVYVNFSFALLIRWLDKNLIDGIVKLFILLIRVIGNFIRQFVAGKIQDYIWWTLVTLIILFIVSRF